jgi:hypothetical protein
VARIVLCGFTKLSKTLSRVGALAAEVHYDLVERSPEQMISKLKRANFSVHLEPAGERAILLLAIMFC